MVRPSASIEHPDIRNEAPDHVRAEFALQTAQAAGAMIHRRWRPRKAHAEIVKGQGGTDFATAVDRDAEQLIRERIENRFPGETFLGEESAPADFSGYDQHPAVWTADPIDGTTIFSRGQLDFGVLVGFLRNGRPEAGSIVLPARNEYWAGSRLHGTAPNSTVRPRLSNIQNPEQATIGHGYGYSQDAKREMHAKIGELITGNFRSFATGSSASLFMDLALGRIDAIVCWGMPWDVSAGGLLVEMAGGKITHHDGSAWSPFRLDYVASNGGPLHDLILELINRPNR